MKIDSKRMAQRSKRIYTRRSTRSKEPPSLPPPTKPLEISTPITEDISDDDVPLIDIRRRKRKSIDTLSMPLTNDSIIPLGTDILSLPGHVEENERDSRFLVYTDTDNLANHMEHCLMVNARSFSSIRPEESKTRDNVLNKIFHIHYIKAIRPNLMKGKKIFFNKDDLSKHQSLSLMSSPTANSFRTDWNLHFRHRSSSHHPKPKNAFHILQLNPKLRLDLSNNLIPTTTSHSPVQTLEHVKDVLARTYYPHLYTAVQCGYQFGAKSTLPHTQQLITTHLDIPVVKQRPDSPCFFADSTAAITLRSPCSTGRSNSLAYWSSPTKSELNDDEKKPILSSISLTQQVDDDIEYIPPLVMKESVVILTPTPIPPNSFSLDKGKKLMNNRKRKSSPVTTNTNSTDRKKKKIVSSSSPPPPSPPSAVIQYEDISHSERYCIKWASLVSVRIHLFCSDEEVLPMELPKQSFIKNGLRSNYYKKSEENNSKPIGFVDPPVSNDQIEISNNSSKTRAERRRRQSSGSLPSFYTGLFESDEEKSPHIDYCLPLDIYYHGQQNSINDKASSLTNSHKKKKSTQPKQKQPVAFKKIYRNLYTDQIKQNLLSSDSSENTPVCDCKPPNTCEDNVCMNRLLSTECSPNCACGMSSHIRRSISHLRIL